MAKAAPKNLLKGLKRPKSAEFQHVETRPDYGKFLSLIHIYHGRVKSFADALREKGVSI